MPIKKYLIKNSHHRDVIHMYACLVSDCSFSAFRLIWTDCPIQSLIVVISRKMFIDMFLSSVCNVSVNDGYILTSLNSCEHSILTRTAWNLPLEIAGYQTAVSVCSDRLRRCITNDIIILVPYRILVG